MASVRDVLTALEHIAPSRYALSFDRVGLQVGDPDQKVTKAVVSLDRSLGAVKFAADCEAELLLTHHPLIFDPISSVDTRSHEGRTIVRLLKQGTSFVAAHTNWDAAIGGINDTLAEMFGVKDVVSFGMSAQVSQLKLVVFCPHEAVDKVINAASEAGAGVIGAYTRCAFLETGRGTFVGGADSNPVIGEPGRQETVEETRVEMVLRESQAKAVSRAVQVAHPYEEPVIEFFNLRGTEEQPLGRIGMLPNPMTLAELATLVDQTLDVRSWTWGAPTTRIKKVAFMGGAAGIAWMDAQRAGADVLITGEVKQQHAVEATESGITLIAAGHYQTEHPGCEVLRKRIEAALPEIEWHLFTPPVGRYGRPF